MKKQQTILITGASSGIGEASAILLAKRGHKVFAGIRRKSDKIRLESYDKNITGVYIDVTNAASIDKAFWFIIKQTDKIDVLINNAGIVVAGPVEILTNARLKEQFEVNTFGPIQVCQKFLPLISGGKVINISSMAATGIFPYLSPYCASKRSLDILFNSFALENKNNIKVISVKPAAIKTPLWNHSVESTRKNLEEINNSSVDKYKNELLYLEKNAIENNFKGIDVKRVTSKILKIVESQNPKASYNVGFMSYLAQFVSHMPISIVNSIIKQKIDNIK